MAPSPFSRPRTPTPKRTGEIAASDDEGSDGSSSDSSLEDLSTLLGGRPQAAPRDADQLLATPQAKRAAHDATTHRTTPLPIIPRHRFDFKALVKDARRDTSLQASLQRAGEPVRDSSTAPQPSTPGLSERGVLSDLVNSGQRRDAHKVLRAVQRADPGHQELRYCFFRTDFDRPAPSRPPPEAMKSPWSLLTKGNQRVREQNLISGVPFNVVGSRGGMPDTVFLWIMDEICAAKSAVVRTELCNLIAICPKQTASLFTPALLKSIWERIGAQDVSLDRREISVAKVSEDVYKGRDWSPLLAVLSLLKDTSSALPLDTRKYALQSLLRMAMDKLVISNVDINHQFEHTVKVLIDTIPRVEWDSLCHDTCSLLQSNFSSQCIRINALFCLPTSPPRAHDLRRRLAITFLFRDASLARRAPEEVITLQAVIKRLHKPDFQVGQSTEFAELRAAVLILDMAIDDGSPVAFPPDTDAEEQFNARVDELAARLNEIRCRINDAGMKLARTEAKSVFEWVQKRVTHTVRTRRKRPKNIFDLPGQERQQQKKDMPRQQEFMKNFLKKKIPSPKLAPGKPEPRPELKLGAKLEPKPQPEPESESEPEEIVLDSIVVRGG